MTNQYLDRKGIIPNQRIQNLVREMKNRKHKKFRPDFPYSAYFQNYNNSQPILENKQLVNINGQRVPNRLLNDLLKQFKIRQERQRRERQRQERQRQERQRQERQRQESNDKKDKDKKKIVI